LRVARQYSRYFWPEIYVPIPLWTASRVTWRRNASPAWWIAAYGLCRRGFIGLPARPKRPPRIASLNQREHWKDGTYKGWGFSRHGNIEATVVITRGRIETAAISQCRTRYSCGVIEPLPGQVIERQSPDVDYVSGATQSADAFYEALVAALQKAKA
jgi:uncharacterized protein with FMN-binding domain